jgi:hypothetical protein
LNLFVMSSGATGPRDDRRPIGVIHAGISTYPPTNRAVCGRASGLYWFGGVGFWALDARR